MKETGDSWEYQATTGDYQLWLNGEGGKKQETQDLGVPYPGREKPQLGGRKSKPGGQKHKVSQ